MFNIRVSGTQGLAFSGTLKVWKDNAAAISQPIKGTAPAEYLIDATRIAVSLKNAEQMSMLKVEILKDGRVVSTSMMTGGGGMMSAMAS